MGKRRQKPSLRTISQEDRVHTLYRRMIKCLSSSESSRWLSRNNGDVVNINRLCGKIVGLFFMSLTPSPETRGRLLRCILDVAHSYNELLKNNKGKFEIVLIAHGDRQSVFYNYRKMMPWLAIPFTESTARNHLYNLAIQSSMEDDDLPKEYHLVLFDGDGNLLRKDAYCLFRIGGADCYPFTIERLGEIYVEDNAIIANKSLKKLLGNPTRDFVIANDRTQVPISNLEKKVVGIYFCHRHVLRSEFTQTLVTLYKLLKRQGRKFEVVMVYTELIGWCGEEYFMQEFQYLPWLALPYMDSNCRRLVRILDPFDRLDDNCLVIIGPGGSFVNRYGYSVVDQHGIEAYPFSRSATAQMEKKKLEELNLKSLLSTGDRDYVISTNQKDKIKISTLWEKTIFLFFIESYCGIEGEPLVTDLLEWYPKIKEKDKDFEVVVVTSTFHEDFCSMPWLMVPHDDARVKSLRSARLNACLSLSVFGPDGKVRSIESEFHFYEKKGIEPYPFSGNDLLKDVQRALAERHMWPPASEECNQPSKLEKP